MVRTASDFPIGSIYEHRRSEHDPEPRIFMPTSLPDTQHPPNKKERPNICYPTSDSFVSMWIWYVDLSNGAVDQFSLYSEMAHLSTRIA